MLIKFIRRMAYKLHAIGKFEADKEASIEKEKNINAKAKVNRPTMILEDAIIANDTGNRDKIEIGKGCIVRGWLLVYNHGGEIKIGDNCFIGPNTKIWSAAKIQIGDRVLISHDVNIHDNNSHPLNSSERHLDYLHIFEKGLSKTADYHEKPIIIDDDAWIGFNCTILKGVTIGRGAIIGACTLVTEDVPAFAIVVGNPARILKYTD